MTRDVVAEPMYDVVLRASALFFLIQKNQFIFRENRPKDQTGHSIIELPYLRVMYRKIRCPRPDQRQAKVI